MNLIQRTTLHYQGNPESVYEVNLWEVEEGKYEVIAMNQVNKGYYNRYENKGNCICHEYIFKLLNIVEIIKQKLNKSRTNW